MPATEVISNHITQQLMTRDEIQEQIIQKLTEVEELKSELLRTAKYKKGDRVSFMLHGEKTVAEVYSVALMQILRGKFHIKYRLCRVRPDGTATKQPLAIPTQIKEYFEELSEIVLP